MKLDEIRIGASPLTDRIYLGTVSKRSATGGIYATQVYAFADAVIAEFCRANGITAPAAQEKP